jgi:hypothetical protein
MVVHDRDLALERQVRAGEKIQQGRQVFHAVVAD